MMVKKMKRHHYLILFFTLLCLPQISRAQVPEVTIVFSEQFLDAVIEGIFKNAAPPEFSLASANADKSDIGLKSASFDTAVSHQVIEASYVPPTSANQSETCRESVRLLPESGGVRTSVRFRDGKILAPLAFEGSYNPPLVGCVDFSGWAESSVDIIFDEPGQRLVARARVSNVSLNGTGGVGGSLIAKMVQSSIDKKINPIEIMRLENVSFLLPIQNSGKMKMKATGIRHEITDGRLFVHIAYQFEKG